MWLHGLAEQVNSLAFFGKKIDIPGCHLDAMKQGRSAAHQTVFRLLQHLADMLAESTQHLAELLWIL